MAYTSYQLENATQNSEALKAIISKRQKQEMIWHVRHEKVIVPTDLNFSDITGSNLLDYATILGDRETIESLVALGVTSKSAVQYALQGGYKDIAQFLIDKNFEYHPLQALSRCDPRCKHLLLHHISAQFHRGAMKILHYGALIPLDDFKALIQNHPDINWEKDLTETDKPEASEPSGLSPVGYAIFIENNDYLEYLFQMGAQANHRADFAWRFSPMQLAIFNGNLKAALFLKSKGADINEVDIMGRSALHLAILSGNSSMVAFVLEHISNINAIDCYGRNPLHYLSDCNNKDIINQVQEHDPLKHFIHEKDYYGRTPLYLPQSHLKQDKSVQNISQERVLRKLRFFLKLTNQGDPLRIPEGHCNAFSFLFLYYKRRGLKEEFFKMLSLIADWDGHPDLLTESAPVEGLSGKYKDVSDLFKQWVNDIIWFQQANLEKDLFYKINPSQEARKEQYDLVKKDERPFTLTFRSLIKDQVLTQAQLDEYLAIFKNMSDIDIELAQGGHSVSCNIEQDGKFDYYDPNHTCPLSPITSSQTLASHIHDTKYRLLNALTPEGKMLIEIRYYPGKNYIAFPDKTAPWTKGSYEEYYQNSPNNLTPLHVAIIANDEEEIKRILQNQDINFSLKDKWGRSALSMAMDFKAKKLVQLFLENNPRCLAENPEILIIAYKMNKPFLDYFLAMSDLKSSGGLLNQAVMDKAYSLVETLLKKGISPDETGSMVNPGPLEDNRPLFNAVREEDLKMIEILMKHGATLPAEPDFFQLLGDKPKAVQFLIDNYPDKIKDFDLFLKIVLTDLRISPVSRIDILNGLKEKRLLTKERIEKACLLHEAIKMEDDYAFFYLLSFNIDLNNKDAEGNTPLHTVFHAKWYSKTDFAKFLIKKGADVSVVDKSNALPLHYAIYYCADNLKLIKKLMSKERVNQRNEKGETPLYIALVKTNAEVAALLLKKGADPKEEGPFGRSILEDSKELCPKIHALILQHQSQHKLREPKTLTPRYAQKKKHREKASSSNQEQAVEVQEERRPRK